MSLTLGDKIKSEYFEWLVSKTKLAGYRRLLSFLHSTEFIFFMDRDSNRYEDGLDLRIIFLYECAQYERDGLYLAGPCSVLEMMVALAIKCEELMSDLDYGDRTSQWFWSMIRSLGLTSMTDDVFDKQYASEVIGKFLSREYRPDGKGGLFWVKNCDRDMRNIEIWHQLCCYINTIT